MNKWLLRLGTVGVALMFITGCATNENPEQPNDAPMDQNEDMMEQDNGGTGDTQ